MFAPEVVTALKQQMLLAHERSGKTFTAEACRFSAGDVQAVTARAAQLGHELSEEQVRKWAKNLRERYDTPEMLEMALGCTIHEQSNELVKDAFIIGYMHQSPANGDGADYIVIPKRGASSGTYKITGLLLARNEKTNEVRCFLEKSDQCRAIVLHRACIAAGMTQIEITSVSRKEPAMRASAIRNVQAFIAKGDVRVFEKGALRSPSSPSAAAASAQAESAECMAEMGALVNDTKVVLMRIAAVDDGVKGLIEDLDEKYECIMDRFRDTADATKTLADANEKLTDEVVKLRAELVHERHVTFQLRGQMGAEARVPSKRLRDMNEILMDDKRELRQDMAAIRTEAKEAVEKAEATARTAVDKADALVREAKTRMDKVEAGKEAAEARATDAWANAQAYVRDAEAAMQRREEQLQVHMAQMFRFMAVDGAARLTVNNRADD